MLRFHLPRRGPRSTTRAKARLTVLTMVGAVFAGLLAPTANADMPRQSFGPVIEALSDYEPQTTCDPHAKPGVLAFRAMVLTAFPGTGDDGITRACDIGGTSEHKEGRAWDWMVSVHDAHQVAEVHELLDWLFAPDQYGNSDAMARRLGIMYVIWDKKIWGAYSADEGWRCYYACPGEPWSYDNDPHTGHVHFSFNWAGARKQTSYWGNGPANPYQQWPGNKSGDVGAVTTGPQSAAPTHEIYLEQFGSAIAAERFARH